MYFRGLTYSFILHILVVLLGTNMFLDIIANQKVGDKQYTNEQESKVIKLEIGSVNYNKNINQQVELHEDSTNYMLQDGKDKLTYGRIVSSILLQELEHYNLKLKGNKVRILLTIDKDGTLLDFELQFSKSDIQIQKLLEKALNRSIKFPPNHNKKRKAKYQVLLF